MRTYAAILLLIAVGAQSDTESQLKPRWTLFPSLVKINGEWDPESRIVGGEVAEPHAWPHQVFLTIDGLGYCGGTLISQNYVLTAAHCADGAGSIKVLMGAHNRINIFEGTHVTMTSKDFTVHPGWNRTVLKNDIALIKLPEAVELTDAIQPATLTDANPETGDIVTLTGWGKTSDFALGVTNKLHQVDVPVVDVDVCNNYYEGEIFFEDDLVCFSGDDKKSSCSGDSGGPMNKDGKVWGVTSFGSSAGCEVGAPGGYTSVAHNKNFIMDNSDVSF